MPDYLSVSQVTTYLGCPRKYRFRYVDGLEPERKSADLAFGSAVHSAIEWWQSERIAGRAPPDEDVLRVFHADWTAQNALGDLDFDGDDPAEMHALGEAILRLYVEQFANDVPTDVEQRFEVPLRDPRTGDTLPLPLVGFLDFTGEGLVGEIKTTARKSGAGQWILQLSAYSYAVRELTGVRPRLRVVQLVKTKVPKIEVEDLRLTDRDEAWFVEIAAEVLDAIARGAFFPNPSWMCSRCEHRRACRWLAG